jgi:uncharacterized membrane protein YhaH (DUF805 family)
MSFQDAVRTCLTKKYMDFNGRARRSEFWYWTLFTVIVSIVAGILDGIFRTRDALGGNGVVATIAGLALLLPSVSVGARRLQDTDRPGWLVALFYGPAILGRLLAFTGSLALIGLLGLLTLVGLIVLIVFWVQDSKPDNQYGPNPKGVGGGQSYQEMPPPAAPQY